MKKIISFIFVFFMFTQIVFASNTEEILYNMYDSTVSIFSTGTYGSSICTGVVYKNTPNKTYIITAKHCSGTYEEVYIEGVLVDYTLESAEDDLAVFVASEPIPGKLPVKIATEKTKRHDMVYHLGFPKLEGHVAVGYVLLNGKDNTYAVLDVIGGCSGGGVFNEKSELVGIVFAKINMFNGVTLFEPITDVVRFLKQIGIYE